MLVGVALSAPVAARLSARLDGRELLRVTCVTEGALRIGTFALLLAGAPLAAVVVAGYGACLLPTWLVAGGALVARAAPLPRAGGLRAVLRGGRLLPNGPRNGLLAFGGMVMLLGSGPTLLAGGLAAELHVTMWVAWSALAFAAGSLLAPLVVARLERRTLPPAVTWPALGIGMAGGWVFAAWSPVALLGAQLLSGMCMSALEGDMDARVATKAASPRGVTAGLATAFAPRVVAEAGVGWLGGALATSLAALAVLRLAGRWSRSAAGRGVGVATARDL
jgi:hypothetical protein